MSLKLTKLCNGIAFKETNAIVCLKGWHLQIENKSAMSGLSRKNIKQSFQRLAMAKYINITPEEKYDNLSHISFNVSMVKDQFR